MKYLMCVDMQKGFITKPQYQNLIPLINGIMKNYDKIFLTKFINTKNSFYETKLNWYALQDEESQQIAVDISKNCTIMEKKGYGLSQKDIEFFKKK